MSFGPATTSSKARCLSWSFYATKAPPPLPFPLYYPNAPIGKQIVFVTNNSTKSRTDYATKLHNLGIPATESEIFGSSYSSAVYIARLLSLPADKRTVFALGESGLESELRAEGLRVIGGTDPALRRDMLPADFASIASGAALDPSVGCVLAGLDFHVNYLKLALAGAYIRQGGARFLATNGDTTLPSHGALFPGAGSISAPLATMCGRQPEMAFGKPNQAMMDAIQGTFSFERSRACMVGDRLDTDIRFGIEGRLGGTLLVLTGVSQAGEWENDKGMTPGWVADKLGDLCS